MALKYRDKPDALMMETSNHTKSIRADSRFHEAQKERAGSSWESVCFRYFSAVMKL